MSSEGAEHQPMEEHADDAPVEETETHDEEQAASPEEEEEKHTVEENVEHAGEPEPQQQGNGAEENAGEEEEGDENGLVEGDLSDPRVFRMATREVDECYMSVIRGLSAFSQEDEEVFANAVDICNDLIAMEQNLFSEAPPYVADYIGSYRAKTDAYNKSVQAHQTIPTAEGTPRDWEERRAYVDPGVPLMLPYDAERFKKEHPERAQSEGTYHNLFYGDGSQVVFEPPADNKRHQLEEAEKKAYHPSKQAPKIFDPPQKKPMRVSADFVPSCADVITPRQSGRTKPAKKVQPKKAQRKSSTKK